LGGGTPTFLTNVQLSRLMQMLKEAFAFTLDAECSIEIDPRRLNDGTLELLADHGFNRLSIGVHDLDPTVQKSVNRLQTAELTQAVLKKRARVRLSVNQFRFDLRLTQAIGSHHANHAQHGLNLAP
jgi:oxygen-independent coproporphyrinogen-3 oxidase